MTSAKMNPAELNAAALILRGGKSRRMGCDKSQLLLGENTFLEIACLRMSQVASQIVLVGRPEQQDSVLGSCPKTVVGASTIHFVSDRVPDRGPLEALTTGLEFLAEGIEFAFVTTCDAPLLVPDLFLFLAGKLDDFDAVFPSDEHHAYGLTAVYRTRTARLLRQLLDSGVRRIIDLPAYLKIRSVELQECRVADPQLLSFENVNTPEEYQAFLQRWNLQHQAAAT